MHDVTIDRAVFLDLAEEILGRGHDLLFVARGCSMHPGVRHGDLVTVRAVAAGGPRPGAIVLYRTRDLRPVVHRVLGRGSDGVLSVRGDGSPGAVERVPASRVMGEVVGVRHGHWLDRGRRLVRALRARLLDAPQRP